MELKLIEETWERIRRRPRPSLALLAAAVLLAVVAAVSSGFFSEVGRKLAQLVGGTSSPRSSDITTLVAILQERAGTIAFKLDGVVAALNAASTDPSDAQAVAQRLQVLKKRFLTLHERHVAAVKTGDIQLSHELTGQINSLLLEIEQVVSSREGAIARRWAGSLRQYVEAPEPGTDPAYDALQRDVLALNEATVSRVRSMQYPGKRPPAVSSESLSWVFDSQTQASKDTKRK